MHFKEIKQSVIHSAHKMTHQRAISLLFLALALFWFFVFCKYRHIQRNSLYGAACNDFSNEWYYKQNGENKYLQLPETIPLDDDGFARIYFDIPQAYIQDFNIGFFTNNQIDVVSLGSYVLESYTGVNYPSWLKVTGASYHIVSIPQNLSVKNLTVCIATKASSKKTDGYFSAIQRGSRSSLILFLVKRCFVRIVISIFIILLGFVLLGIVFVFRKQLNGDHTLCALGCLTLLVGCWLLEETFFTQLLFTNPLVHWLFDYFFFITMSIAFFYFTEEVSGVHTDKGLGILTYVTIAVIVFEMVLQVGFKIILPQTLFLSHILLVVSSIYLIVFFVREIKKGNTRMNHYLPAILVLILGATIELANYYLQKFETNIALTFAFLIFFIYLGIQVYHASVGKIQELADATTYHKLAFIDFSTGVYNRTAYYTFVEKYQCKSPHKYCVIIFDMNNLKKINDHYGHLYGDKVIKTFSDCAQKSFGSFGKVYRIGGDEFLALLRDPTYELVEKACVRFEKYVENQQEVQYKFTVAYGTNIFYASEGDDFFAAQKIADADMYKMKALMKKEHKIESFQLVTDNENVPKDDYHD